MKRPILALSAWAILVGCGQDGGLRMAGGGSDQPNKLEVAGRILNQDGSAASGAQVVAWAGKWTSSFLDTAGTAVDSGLTAPDGGWRLKVPDSPNWYVTARAGTARAVSLPGQSEARLVSEARIRGTVRSNRLVHLDAMWIAGAGESVPLQWMADSSAVFSTTALPGDRRIWGRLSWKGGSETILLAEKHFEPGDNPEMIIEADTGNVLLASAEAHPIGSSLRGVDFDARDTEFGRWFHTIDAGWGGGSTIAPANFPDTDSALGTDRDGKFFSWTFALGKPIDLANNLQTDPWAGVGLRLSKRDLDWTGVKALRLVLTGAGTKPNRIWMQVNTTAVDRIGGGQFRTLVVLPSGWSTMDVPLDNIHMFAPAGSKADSLDYTWNTVRRSVHDVVFYAAGNDVTLQLREVRAIGNRRIRW